MSDGQSAFLAFPPKKSAIVYTYGGFTIALRLMSGRRKAICIVGDKPYVMLTDSIDGAGFIAYVGADRLGDRQLLISPDEKFYYSDAPPHGTGSVQSIDLTSGLVTIANIASPFDGSFNLRRGYRGLTKRMNVSAAHPNGYYTFWGLLWPVITDPLDFRNKGLVTFFKDDCIVSTAFQTLPGGGFQDTDVILSYDANYIWMLCHDKISDTYYISVVNNDFAQSALQNLTTLKNNLPANQPVQFLYNDAAGKMAILMADTSIQIWSANALTGTVAFLQTINIPNVRFNDTATLMERLQPFSNIGGGFWIARTTNAGTSRSIARVSWNDGSILEEFDFSNYIFQDSSSFPAPANFFNDAAYDPSTGELFIAFSNAGGGAERKFQLASLATKRMFFS